MSTLRYVSLFSGIEAASCAWKDLPLTPVAFSEIEKFPCNVLKYHYPDIPNLGDITKITLPQIEALGKIDLVVGGSPCQGFSVAGYQKGLNDERSKLAINYISIIRTIRPRWLLWENVPGVLSANGGNDFKHFISALAQCGYSLVWRVLDAKYFGVPQRRRRIFLVGYLAEKQSPPPVKVLFEPKGLQWDFAQSENKKQRTSANVEELIRKTSRDMCLDMSHTHDVMRYHNNETPCLASFMGTGGNNIPLVFGQTSFAQFKQTDTASTLTACGGTLGGGSENFFLWTSENNFTYKEQDIAKTLCAVQVKRPENLTASPTYAIAGNIIGRDIKNGGNGLGYKENEMYTLTTADRPAVANPEIKIRKLTPVECLRLQGFPDDWLEPVPGYSDSAAYKAIGNSMAVPVMKWIGDRIVKYENGEL